MHCRYTLYQNISRKAKIDGSDSTMMNRSTQKELIKLLLQLNEMWPQLDLSNMEQQNMVLDILNTVSTKCQKDFSKVNADRYVDTVESLGNVIKMTDWQHMASEELNQCLSLCQEIILQVINNLRNEKELKKDIVFLPYQASMWDSLESVWKAANEDKEHCNTYVIPIPYADLTPEHTAAEWHCERGLFPEYVPTLDWQTIDLEEMHPDVIFIHNPYDEYNRVTSVESRYYSSNLKHYTDKLVYIPYSVEEEIQPGNEAAENAIEHRILLPAFMNADLIIAQSEDMRQAWINILVRRTDKKDRAYWEKRILGLGSPKIDKVLTSKKEDFEMPEKWKKLIGNKKVILYITSIAPMLQNSNKVCDKLRYVFDIFRNRNDVVLWWRPHPLMKATFHSMRPQYETEYLSIVKKYIEEGWGIYDDSSELHRAISWSDAYYGDLSSVATLYRTAGKTVMIQDIKKDLSQSHHLRIPTVDIVENNMYFVSIVNGMQALYRFNLKVDSLECLGRIPYNIRDTNGYASLGKIGNKIIIAPCFCTQNFIEYNIQDHQFKKKEGKGNFCLLPDTAAFTNVIHYRNSLFFFNNISGVIVEYNFKRDEYVYHDNWSSSIKKIERLVFYWNSVIRVENRCFLPVMYSDLILELDLDTCNLCNQHRLGMNLKVFSMSYDGIYFWITTVDGKILRWNIQDNDVEMIIDNGQKKYINSLSSGSKQYFFPEQTDTYFYIDKKFGSIEVLGEFSGPEFVYQDINQDIGLAYSYVNGVLLEYSISKKNGNRFHVVDYGKDEVKKLYKEAMSLYKKHIVYESYTVLDVLDLFSMCDKSCNTSLPILSGDKILEYIQRW